MSYVCNEPKFLNTLQKSEENLWRWHRKRFSVSEIPQLMTANEDKSGIRGCRDVRCAVYDARQLLSIIGYEHNKGSTQRLPVACIRWVSPQQHFDTELHASINLLVVTQLVKTPNIERGFPLIKRKGPGVPHDLLHCCTVTVQSFYPTLGNIEKKKNLRPKHNKINTGQTNLLNSPP